MSERARQKAESRARILEAAARLFRRDGFNATGVDAVMAEAGLTAGGFYSHFKSKAELLEECLRTAYEQSGRHLTTGLTGTPKEKVAEIRKRYLSRLHRDWIERGCPIVGLAAELGRHSEGTASITSGYIESLLHRFEELGLSRAEAIAEISAAVGALLLARQLKGVDLGEEILDRMARPERSREVR